MPKRRREVETDVSKMPKILDGTYYEVREHNKETKWVAAKCLICTKGTIVKGRTNSTGNFHSHFYRYHTEENIENLKHYCDEDEKSTRKVGENRTKRVQTLLPFAGSLDQIKVSFHF